MNKYLHSVSRRHFIFIMLLCFSVIENVQAYQLDSSISAEWLVFTEDSSQPQQHDSYLSASIETEYITEWNSGDDVFTFKPFYRVDEHDDNRSHGDIRELSWIHAADDWEILVGIGKVFWGVTESAHLVDIINQSDLVENGDGEDKLGQPIINLSLIRDWGVVDLFVLPGFRERTFASAEGRPRPNPPVDNDNACYESSDEDSHVDLAIRWSHSLGDWDIGLAHFTGTSREPRFAPACPYRVVASAGKPLPVYEQINQSSVDLQTIYGSWLWKMEVIRRSGQGKTFTAAAGGFEYTFVGVMGSQIDIGVISEYLFDSRDASTVPPLSNVIFQDDLVMGMRLTLNDAQSTELLASVIADLEGDGLTYNVEASRRVGENWKASLEARGVVNVKSGGMLDAFKQDNRLRLELIRYF